MRSRALVLGFILSSLVGHSAFADELSFRPARPRIGDVVLVFVHVASLETETGTVTAFGYRFSLSPSTPTEWRGALAVPVEIEAGKHPVTIELGGRQLVRALEIEARSFRRSELSVGKKFTTKKQPAAVAARIERESKAWQRMLVAGPGPSMTWDRAVRPAAGERTSEFGVERVLNGVVDSQHYGLDLDGKVGDPVMALQSGRVVLADDRFYSGGTLVLDHGHGLYSAYFHLSKRGPRRGARVRAGDRLGAVGRTGRVTGPHLHLALFVRAQSVSSSEIRGLYGDPEPWLDVDWASARAD